MNVWSKLLTALRGGANEMGEAVVDSQALRILDQEIRDADLELRRSREALAEIMAKQKLAAERVAKVAAQVAEYEKYALKALQAGNQSLAHEVAEKIAQLESESRRKLRSMNSGEAVTPAVSRRLALAATLTMAPNGWRSKKVMAR